MISHDSPDPDERWAAQSFPDLIGKGRKTSDQTILYNCLAWALGINWTWFDPVQRMAGYHWPPGIQREWTIPTIRKIFQRHGYYEECDHSLEEGFEKVAIFADDDGPTHFARQLPDGKWTSKLGFQIDIEHADLVCLYGVYGPLLVILKRRIPLEKA